MEERRISVDDVTLRWMQKEADDLDANFRILSNYFDWVKTGLQRDVIESQIQWVKGILSRIENEPMDVPSSTLDDLAGSLNTLIDWIEYLHNNGVLKNRTGIENIGHVNGELCLNNIFQIRSKVNELLGISPPVDPDEEEEAVW